MIPLRVEAEAAALLGAGAVAVVLAPGAALPGVEPLLCLELRDGVLVRPGVVPSRLALLPPGARLLALLAPEAGGAARLSPLLPAGIRVLTGEAVLPGLVALLAAGLREAADRREAAEAARDAAARALGDRPPPVPVLAREVVPAVAGPSRAVQPLGWPAEGLCSIELHLAAATAGAASLLRVRLVAEGRVVAAWVVPGPALRPGWIALDLPEPARLGAAEAVLEVAAEAAPGDRLVLSAMGDGDAALAMRLWTSAPGRHVLPPHLDWSALDAPVPAGLPLALPEAALRATEVEGATARLVAAGEEPARLILGVPPGAEALVRLPPLPACPADLLRAEIACREGDAARIEASFSLETPAGAVATGWRSPDADGLLGIALPLPGGAARPCLALRNGGDGPVLVELSRLVVMAGAAGEKRHPPPAEPQRAAKVLRPAASIAVALPGGLPGGAAPQPLAAAPRQARPVAATQGATTWQEVKLQQHMVSPDGGYRHLDFVVTGLVADAGLWRQARTKLFERRGTVGLEFREAKGWPRMFDIWPIGGTDGFGPFWRLETEEAAASLSALATPRDRALVAALMEILPSVTARAAGVAGLAAAEADAWAGRARALAAAVAAGRRSG